MHTIDAIFVKYKKNTSILVHMKCCVKVKKMFVCFECLKKNNCKFATRFKKIS